MITLCGIQVEINGDLCPIGNMIRSTMNVKQGLNYLNETEIQQKISEEPETEKGFNFSNEWKYQIWLLSLKKVLFALLN